MDLLTAHPQHPNFLLHVITKENYFFCDLTESDETNAVKMTDKALNLISDNCHAANFLFDLLQTDSAEITALSEDMKYNRAEMIKEAKNNR